MFLFSYHDEVTWVFSHVDIFPVSTALFLSFFSALGLFPGPGFLFRHLCAREGMFSLMTTSSVLHVPVEAKQTGDRTPCVRAVPMTAEN